MAPVKLRQAILSLVVLLAIENYGQCQVPVEIFRGVTYVERGTEKIAADLYVPKAEGRYPGVIMVHGGAWRYGQRWQVYRHAQVLAEGGYVVMAISYRLAPDHKFPAQIEDCKEAVRWLRKNAPQYKVDPDQLAGYGYSAAAHLVCLLGMTDAKDGLDGPDLTEKADTRLQAVVAGGTPCDFDWVPPKGQFMSYLFGGSPLEKPDLYRLASPLNFVTSDDPPVFFWHGENDELVSRTSPERMSERLKKAGVRSELVFIPGTGHIGAFLDEQIPFRARKFLDQTLKSNTKDVSKK